MENIWTVAGTQFYPGTDAMQIKILPKGNYILRKDPMTKILYLERVEDKFGFTGKLYNFEEPFIARVEKTWNNSKGNLGILLNGKKGTGKSVTSKLICNRMELPNILITEVFQGIPEFISAISQDIVVFMDEYEKVFSNSQDEEYEDKDASLLTVMDGVLSSKHRRLFILTTNKLWIDDNLLDRPSRILYHVEYSDLERAHIEHIVDDMLLYPELKTGVIEYLQELELITVDIVQAVIREVNIHKEDPSSFQGIFNAKRLDDLYSVILTHVRDKHRNLVPLKEEEQVYERVRLQPSRITKESKGQMFRVNGSYEGKILEVKSENTLLVELNNRYDEVNNSNRTTGLIRLERERFIHQSYLV